jgi:hypothetical protein
VRVGQVRGQASEEEMKSKTRMVFVCLALSLALPTTAFAQQRWVKVSAGIWDVTPQILADLTTEIESYIRNQAKEQRRELKNWEDYAFQYQGREENGRKYIFINALCDQGVKNKDLSIKMIHVFDGGSCYFSLKYDPEHKKFFDLIINGDA